MVNHPEVIVLGEVLVELSSSAPLADGVALRLGFSGDALNSAAAAAAAGAHAAVLARVPDDDLGDALVRRVEQLGVDSTLIRRSPGQHGYYLQHPDPEGRREFVYARHGSVGSQLRPDDLDVHALAAAAIVVATGVSAEISPTAHDAVALAARSARRFVYDPNWRSRLVSATLAAEHLREFAPFAALVKLSWPSEAQALLGSLATTPADVARELRRLGAAAVVVTLGSEGAFVDGEGDPRMIAAFPPPRPVVDQTGAGDALLGTTVARLARGDDLVDAVRFGAAAASLSLGGAGGTGYIPTWAETSALAASVEATT